MNVVTVQQGADMIQRSSESFSVLDWALTTILPPRDPDDDEDEDDSDEQDDEGEPAVIREPDEDD
jgi:hypothetical protein